MNTFVVARFLQGIGGGALYAVLFSLTAHCYSETLRPKVIGLISAAWLVPAMLGPVAAGWLSDHLDWRAVFILQIPLLLVTLVTVHISLRRFNFESSGAAAKRRTMILALSVALLVTAASLALSYGTNFSDIVLAISLVAIAILGIRSIAPSSMRVQHSPQAALATTRGLVHFSFYAADVMIPLVLVRQYDYSASEAGLVLVIGALGWTAASALAASKRTRHYRRELILTGNALLFSGLLASIAVLQWNWDPMLFVVSWVLVGAGMGLVYNCASAQLMDGAPKSQIGKTSTVASMSDAIGVVLASGIGGYLINNLNLVSATTLLWCLALVSCLALALVSPKNFAFEDN
jgi:MFS family permease